MCVCVGCTVRAFLLALQQALQDWMLALSVAVLVAIDVIILTTYNVVEGLKGNLVAERVINPENPEDLSGVSNDRVSSILL